MKVSDTYEKVVVSTQFDEAIIILLSVELVCSDTCTPVQGGGGGEEGGERGGEGGKERIELTGIHDQLDENESTHAKHFWQ